MLDDLDLSGIQDERARALIVRLLNLIDDLAADLRAAQDENQRLRDAINRLKGEPGKPTVKPDTPPPATDPSAEQERRQPTERVKRGRRALILIDREQVLHVDRAILPPDAEFKGYEDVVVQDLVIRTDNVGFHKEVFYSSAAGASYRAPPAARLREGIWSGRQSAGARPVRWVPHERGQNPRVVREWRHAGS